jgi:hypothetical protein
MASNPSDGPEPARPHGRQTIQLSHADLHEVCWKAQQLSQIARSALGETGCSETATAQAQATFDLLWRAGFRPSDGR